MVSTLKEAHQDTLERLHRFCSSRTLEELSEADRRYLESLPLAQAGDIKRRFKEVD